MKKIAIILTIFPGSLFALALISFIICSIAEIGLPSGGVNIGLCLIGLTVILNIPTIIAWFAARRGGKKPLPKTLPSGEDFY